MDYTTEIAKLRRELNRIPENRRYNLGGKGVEIIRQIHRLEIELERKIKSVMEAT